MWGIPNDVPNHCAQMPAPLGACYFKRQHLKDQVLPPSLERVATGLELAWLEVQAVPSKPHINDPVMRKSPVEGWLGEPSPSPDMGVSQGSASQT